MKMAEIILNILVSLTLVCLYGCEDEQQLRGGFLLQAVTNYNDRIDRPLPPGVQPPQDAPSIYWHIRSDGTVAQQVYGMARDPSRSVLHWHLRDDLFCVQNNPSIEGGESCYQVYRNAGRPDHLIFREVLD